MLLLKTISVLLFLIGLFGIPDNFAALFRFLQFVTEPQSIRNCLLLLAIVMFFSNKIILHLPFLRKSLGYIQIHLFHLHNLSEIVDQRARQMHLAKEVASEIEDSIRFAARKSLVIVPIRQVIRAGYLEAYCFDETTGNFFQLTPAKIAEVRDFLDHGVPQRIYINKTALDRALKKFSAEYQAATGSKLNLVDAV